jgi:hypothetical protein
MFEVVGRADTAFLSHMTSSSFQEKDGYPKVENKRSLPRCIGECDHKEPYTHDFLHCSNCRLIVRPCDQPGCPCMGVAMLILTEKKLTYRHQFPDDSRATKVQTNKKTEFIFRVQSRMMRFKPLSLQMYSNSTQVPNTMASSSSSSSLPSSFSSTDIGTASTTSLGDTVQGIPQISFGESLASIEAYALDTLHSFTPQVSDEEEDDDDLMVAEAAADAASAIGELGERNKTHQASLTQIPFPTNESSLGLVFSTGSETNDFLTSLSEPPTSSSTTPRALDSTLTTTRSSRRKRQRKR